MSEREQGIKAIIALQKLAGIKETKAKATKGWDSLTAAEKANTLAAYKVLVA